MSQTIIINAGTDAIVGEESINSELWGGVYTGYRKLSDFQNTADYINLSLIRYPGGSRAENDSNYDLTNDNLLDVSGKGLSDVMLGAVEDNQTLAIVIPTVRYANDIAQAVADIELFLERLDAGFYGEVPDKIILEIGNEYYGNEPFKSNPELYGEVAAALTKTINDAINTGDYPNLIGVVETSIQLGKPTGQPLSNEDNQAIMNGFVDYFDGDEVEYTNAISSIDSFTFHNYYWDSGIGNTRPQQFNDALEEWIEIGAVPSVELFASEFNVATWTRSEAINHYIEYVNSNLNDPNLEIEQNDDGDITLISDGSVVISFEELQDRSNFNFETFWQTGQVILPNGGTVQTANGIENRAYGLEQAVALLDRFSAFNEAGVDMGALYGIDVNAGAHLSWQGNIFIGGTATAMFGQAIEGMHATDAYHRNDTDSEFYVHSFEDTSKYVVYITANEFDESNGPITVDVSLIDLPDGYSHVWAQSLNSELRSDWREYYSSLGLELTETTNSQIDDTPESQIYETGVTENFIPEVDPDGITLTFSESYQVVQLVFTLSDPKKDKVYIWADEIDDTLHGVRDDDVIYGNGGEDRIEGRLGNDDLYGGADSDILIGNDGNDNLYGGPEGDQIYGGNGSDLAFGDDGNDTIYGHADNDIINGGDGEDRIYCGYGNDIAYGGDGIDQIEGNEGDDTIFGGNQNDVLAGNNGNDVLYGGNGGDVLRGGSSIDVLHGDAENDLIYGGGGDDILFGGKGNDLLKGNGDNDTIEGGDGNDTLIGGKGDDTLIGGEGDDTLIGNSGSDVFVFNDSPNEGHDVIKSFDATEDLLYIEGVSSIVDVTIEQVGNDTVITTVNGSITINNVQSDIIDSSVFNLDM